jgi:hypothetical protein
MRGSDLIILEPKRIWAMSGMLVNEFSMTTHQILGAQSTRQAKSIATAPPEIKSKSNFDLSQSIEQDYTQGSPKNDNLVVVDVLPRG